MKSSSFKKRFDNQEILLGLGTISGSFEFERQNLPRRRVYDQERKERGGEKEKRKAGGD
jgi:hypothetical protein